MQVLCRIQPCEQHSLKLLLSCRDVGKVDRLVVRPQRDTGCIPSVRCVGLVLDVDWREGSLWSFGRVAPESYRQVSAISIRNCFDPAQKIYAVGFEAMFEGAVSQLSTNHNKHATVAILQIGRASCRESVQ